VLIPARSETASVAITVNENDSASFGRNSAALQSLRAAALLRRYVGAGSGLALQHV
jgi:hypothetical protein